MKNLLEHFPIDGINNLRHSPTLRNMEWLGYECCEHLLPEESISVEEATVVERTNGVWKNGLLHIWVCRWTMQVILL